ncbi:hypothetical protein [aff. Roholtiella sp. LEGE 12411]|uniref:hypothetical protein n=1 Tax=aff. Roholtiella sp. LEGE 12411 TaxID=1828822 RepID=UPI0018806C30|nr:hypothetical protein [aff. Roholtiella sp. LEGE 12411]
MGHGALRMGHGALGIGVDERTNSPVILCSFAPTPSFNGLPIPSQHQYFLG